MDVSLLDVIVGCGPTIAALAVPTGGLELPVRRLAAPAGPFSEGDLVLVRAGDEATPELCSSAAEARCAGLLIPLVHPGPWEQQATSAGIPLLRFDIGADDVGTRVNELLQPVTDGSATALDIRIGDLDRLAEGLADLVGGPIILEDAQFKVLAYSPYTGDMDAGRSAAILGRQIPTEWMDTLQRTGALTTLRTSSQVVDLHEGPWEAHRRLLVAVRSGGRVLGIIWVAEGDRPLPSDADRRMQRAAMLAVPHFLQYDDEFRAERQRRGRLVMELLDGVSAPGHRLAEIGLSRAAVLAVVCIAPVRTADQPRPDLIERIAMHLSLTCESFHRPAAVAWVGDKAYALVEVPDGTGEAIDRIVQESVRRSTGLAPGGTVGGSSRPNPRLRGLPARRLEAEDVVTLLRSRPELGATGDYPSLQPYVLLNRTLAGVSESGDARLPGLDQLADHDTEKRTDYIRSLLAYFGAGGNVTSAARALDVHPTTLRYRLEQARRISGLQLDEHDVQLACELALRAHRESPP